MSKIKRFGNSGFTLVELLVVMMIITILYSVLLPAISRARENANAVVCQSNMRQIGIAMLTYADTHDGWLFPTDMGWDQGTMGAPGVTVYYDPALGQTVHNVWTIRMFSQWNPPVMICPDDDQPNGEHSYVLNSHMGYWNIKYSTQPPLGRSPADVVLMGEKVTLKYDYYMEYGDFNTVVEQYRHGKFLGSNYLMLDLHVETQLPQDAINGLDPWDFAAGLKPPTTTGPGT
jgi:prepilin-type N-terminal cleavage/methylation domain-containing protein/prepilin-type processing-associated H-X9-DG protein